jgi:hypothetical protein
MEITERGCVYFFRHIGLSPVKIGYSTNESPINRFESFKTYAPYGAELLGFIMTKESKELETILHERFSTNRLKGEWFEISKEDVQKVVSFYSNIEDIKEKNEFEIAYAKYKNENLKENLGELGQKFSKKYSVINKNGNLESIVLTQKQLMECLEIDRISCKQIINAFKICKKAYRINELVKKGYKLYLNVH